MKQAAPKEQYWKVEALRWVSVLVKASDEWEAKDKAARVPGVVEVGEEATHERR